MSATAIRRGLYGKLAGDTTLVALLGTPAAGYTQSIYHQEAPPDASFPFVVFSKSSGVPTEAFHDPAAFEDETWLIKAIDRSRSADDAEGVTARLQVLLNDAALSISGGTLMYLRRQSDVDYSELIEGVSYKHVGSLWRLVWES